MKNRETADYAERNVKRLTSLKLIQIPSAVKINTATFTQTRPELTNAEENALKLMHNRLLLVGPK